MSCAPIIRPLEALLGRAERAGFEAALDRLIAALLAEEAEGLSEAA
jgi:hypothetical protein